MARKETQSIKTEKGHLLAATFYIPEGEVKAAVLVVPAIGASQNYYSSFATWLSNKGYLVVTFDYFGMGLSLSGKLKDVKITIIDWAINDCTAMVKSLSELNSEKPLYWIGHSLGAQVLGFLPCHALITKAVTITGGSGYWRENSSQLKRRALFLWHVVGPLATWLYGYFPGKRLHIVGDLPKDVLYQWRRWCLNPEYMIGAEGEAVKQAFNAVEIPIVSISVTDDELMSEKNINSLHSFYASAPKKMIRISPQEIGVERIGHFGFFKEQFEKKLWQTYLLPLITVDN